MVIKNGSVLSEKVGGGSEGSNGGSENGSGVFLEVKSSIVSLLDDSVVSSVSSEVSVTIKVSSNKSHDTSANGESVMEDSPSDTFPARRGSERTFVGVELIGVEAVHEALKRYHRFGLAPPCRGAFSGTTSTSRDVVKVHGAEESIGTSQILFTIFEGFTSFVFAVSLSEHNSQHSVVNLVVKISILSFLSSSEPFVGAFSFSSREHNEMHFEVIILVINSVFTGGMYVQLVGLVNHTLKFFLFSFKGNNASSIELNNTLHFTVSL